MSDQSKDCDDKNLNDWRTYANLLKTNINHYKDMDIETFVRNMTDRLELCLDDIRGVSNTNKLNALNSVPPELLPFPINLIDGNRVVLISTDPVAIVSNFLLDNLKGTVINAYIRKRGEEKPEDLIPPRRAFPVPPLSPKSRKAPSFFKRWREEDGSFGPKANVYDDPFSGPDINHEAESASTSDRESKVIVSQPDINCKPDSTVTYTRESNDSRCASVTSTSNVTVSQPDLNYEAELAVTAVKDRNGSSFESEAIDSQPNIKCKSDSSLTFDRESYDSEIVSFETVTNQSSNNVFPVLTRHVPDMEEDMPNECKNHSNVLESTVKTLVMDSSSSSLQSSQHHCDVNISLPSSSGIKTDSEDSIKILNLSPQSHCSHTNVTSPPSVSGFETIETDNSPCSDFSSNFQVLGAIDFGVIYSSSPEEFEISQNENVNEVIVIDTEFGLTANRNSPCLLNKQSKKASVNFNKTNSKVRNSITKLDQRKKNLIMRKKRRYLGAKSQK